MLTEEQVKALELKGLTYWQCEGKDYALHLPTILEKQEKLLEQGIQIVDYKNGLIGLMPASWGKTGTVEVCNTIPLYVNTRTSTIVGSHWWLLPLCLNFITLDFSKTYIRPTDFLSIKRLSEFSQHIILSSSFDKPSITSLNGLFVDAKAEDINFTDFRGCYIKYVEGMFQNSGVQSITWDYADFSNIESARWMFCNTKISSVNLSTFPMLPPARTTKIFLGSNLFHPYTEDSLASGELQAWCKKRFQKS